MQETQNRSKKLRSWGWCENRDRILFDSPAGEENFTYLPNYLKHLEIPLERLFSSPYIVLEPRRACHRLPNSQHELLVCVVKYAYGEWRTTTRSKGQS